MTKFLLVSLMVTSMNVSANEGMWPFNRISDKCKKQLKEQYNFELTQDWLEQIKKSSLRLSSGGTGSFVSEDGLVLTNHHVAFDSLQDISTEEKDYIADGFYAPTLADEIQIPNLKIDQLVEIRDFTDQVKAAEKEGMSSAEKRKAREKIINEIKTKAKEESGLETEMVSLYDGEKFDLYYYKRYTDVRAVFAPEHKVAFLGGDADNFDYPRYNLDMTLFRVYENGKPAKVSHHLKWSEKGPKEGEFLVLSGNPGHTSRLKTVAALEFLRDVSLPYTLSDRMRIEAALNEYGARGAEQKRQAMKTLQSVENSRKAFLGELNGLRDPQILEAKRQYEQKLRAQAKADPKLAQYLGAWDAIANVQIEYGKIIKEFGIFSASKGLWTRYFHIARHLVRLGDEREKPNSDRLPEYAESELEALEHELFAPTPIYNEFEEFKLTKGLELLISVIGPEHKFRPLVEKILQGKSPAERAKELIAGTKLKDIEERKRLYEGGKAAVEKSTDSMIMLARLVDAVSREQRKHFEDSIEGVEEEFYPQIAKVVFAIEGTQTSPDATFTPRLAFGSVKGYTDKNGKVFAPWTTMGGTYAHAEKNKGKPDFELPKSWIEARGKFNEETPYNFICTNDSTGGNSGSPMVNRDGELVGLLFDGNLPGLVWDYVYTDVEGRSVAVHSAGMTEALENIYGARRIVQELRGKH